MEAMGRWWRSSKLWGIFGNAFYKKQKDAVIAQCIKHWI
jgi:hypothetical protein